VPFGTQLFLPPRPATISACRAPRHAPGGIIYHALNRAVARLPLFQKDGDFEAFERVLAPALKELRYVERNALRANLVKRAEDWRWSSLWRRRCTDPALRSILTDWPVEEPADWVRRVNQAQTPAELQALRRSVIRGRPFGSELWARRVAKRLGLEYTLRPRGRPRKKGKGPGELR
jgi:putative transposase